VAEADGVGDAAGVEEVAGDAVGAGVDAGTTFSLTDGDGLSAAGEGVDEPEVACFFRAFEEGLVSAALPLVVGPTNFPCAIVPE
jgi:hypothetical protein